MFVTGRRGGSDSQSISAPLPSPRQASLPSFLPLPRIRANLRLRARARKIVNGWLPAG